MQFLPPPTVFAAKHQKTKEKKNQFLEKARGYTFTLPLDDSIIPSPYDHVRLLELSLKPSSWANFLYQIYCIGPVGFGLICVNSKEPHNSGPYNIYIYIYIYLLLLQIKSLRRAKLLQMQNQREHSYHYHQRELTIIVFLLFYFLRKKWNYGLILVNGWMSCKFEWLRDF